VKGKIENSTVLKFYNLTKHSRRWTKQQKNAGCFFGFR